MLPRSGRAHGRGISVDRLVLQPQRGPDAMLESHFVCPSSKPSPRRRGPGRARRPCLNTELCPFDCCHRSGRIFRFVDVTANKRHHVRRPLDYDLGRISASKTSALLQQSGWYLVGHYARSLDEYLIGGARRLCCEDRHSDGAKDIEIVGLSPSASKMARSKWCPSPPARRNGRSGWSTGRKLG